MSDIFQPFVPDPVEPRRRLFNKPVPFRVIAPNLITLVALCLGLTAIRPAYEGRLEPAVIAIVVAALLDGVDGRVARLLKGTSRFGAELDSLRSEEHTSELQSRQYLVCRLLLEKKKKSPNHTPRVN